MNKNVMLLGGILIDRYMQIDNYPICGGDTIINEIKDYVGGCPYNVGIALKNLGINPIIYSAIGTDDLGSFISNNLNKLGFDQRLIYTIDHTKTGVCLIFLDADKERTFFAKHEVEGHFDDSIISDDILEHTDYIYVSGIYLLYPEYVEKILRFLEKAYLNHKKIIFDAAPMVSYINSNILKRILEITYLLKVNQVERNTIETIFNNILSTGTLFTNIKYIVETYGKAGSTLIYPMPITVPSQDIVVLDSNGAGDNYLAGLIFSLMNDYPISKALEVASICGALACMTLGTNVTYKMEDINKYLNK